MLGAFGVPELWPLWYWGSLQVLHTGVGDVGKLWACLWLGAGVDPCREASLWPE